MPINGGWPRDRRDLAVHLGRDTCRTNIENRQHTPNVADFANEPHRASDKEGLNGGGGVQGELVSGVVSLICREILPNLTLLAEPELNFSSISEAVAANSL